MFNWLGLLSGILKLSNFVAEIARDKQLLDAGEYRAIAKANGEALEKIKAVQLARAGVKHDADSVRNDSDNRRNH